MADWKSIAQHLGLTIEDLHDRLTWKLKQELGGIEPVCIVPYRGHGTQQEVYLRGRVLEDKRIERAQESDSVWENLWAMYRRFESDEIPGVRVRGRFQGGVQEVVTDEEGYFEFRFQVAEPLSPDRDLHEVELELLDEVVKGQGEVRARGEILAPPPTAGFGVISDIDDTVLHSFSATPLRAIREMLLNNARTRLPFEGVGEFYRALRNGATGIARNPIFYVSSSPWNLYDLLIDFFEINSLPPGPLFLQDFGLDEEKIVKRRNVDHKIDRIRHIMGVHASLPFVLIGDSGEHDAEIYRQVVEEYPDRINAVYIRDVSTADRDVGVVRIASELASRNVEMLLVPDTQTARRHALEHGLIRAEPLP